MNKLYGKPFLLIKAICCLLLTPLFLLISSLVNTEDPFVYLLISTVPVMALYTVPYWVTLHCIRKYPVNKIGKYIALDALCVYLPTVAGILGY